MPFYFGSNFKMHQTPTQTAAFITALRQLAPDAPEIQRFLIPPFTSLNTAAPLLQNSPIWLGAQTMHWAEQGAYTGEISATMLQEIGVDLVMLGHAERRTLFGENDVALRKKVNAAAEAGLRILLCVGENAEEEELRISYEVVKIQLRIALFDMTISQMANLCIAYEPVWSIGKDGKPADPFIVEDMHRLIRGELCARFGDEAISIPILYGGSVNRDNCAAYAALPNVNGLFVGRAAWTPEGFVDVMRAGFAAHSES